MGLLHEGAKIRGTFFGGPYMKDHRILGSISGSPHFGKLPYSPYIRESSEHSWVQRFRGAGDFELLRFKLPRL